LQENKDDAKQERHYHATRENISFYALAHAEEMFNKYINEEAVKSHICLGRILMKSILNSIQTHYDKFYNILLFVLYCCQISSKLKEFQDL
jgi:hypothetical protein